MTGPRFRRVSLTEIAPLRVARAASLRALPELYIEMAVEQSRLFALGPGLEEGYIAVHDRTLVEVHLAEPDVGHAQAVVRAAVADLGVRTAWAATFDPLAIDTHRALGGEARLLGFSFRTWAPAELPEPDVVERQATTTDVERIGAINHPDVFDKPADIPVWVERGWVTLFEAGAALAGFGLCTPTGGSTPACDVGVCVAPDYRRRGLGAWIIQRMAARAHAQGLVPTAGCAADNTASRRTLERAGFLADHELYAFELPQV